MGNMQRREGGSHQLLSSLFSLILDSVLYKIEIN